MIFLLIELRRQSVAEVVDVVCNPRISMASELSRSHWRKVFIPSGCAADICLTAAVVKASAPKSCCIFERITSGSPVVTSVLSHTMLLTRVYALAGSSLRASTVPLAVSRLVNGLRTNVDMQTNTVYCVSCANWLPALYNTPEANHKRLRTHTCYPHTHTHARAHTTVAPSKMRSIPNVGKK